MRKNSHNDEELLEQIQLNRDAAAFTTLYERYWEKLLTLAYIRLQSSADAQEVVQEVFLDIWKRAGNISLEYSFHTYISAALKYKILTLLAKRKAEQAKSSLIVQDEADASTEQWLSYQQLRQELEQTVQTLPEKCRLVFRLSREKGMSEKQIARTLNISIKTVEAHISKALKTLRTSLHHLHTFFLW
ncbi:RNA polymerase sigma-70 factor [Chitinophaga ginsengisoli]|uniref:RNA polymerase sigma-70 factor (ECF subfamily) n=1 Tax=Chitinophaga ginsengisoli TaxID=363837 RepID=A0A2P8GKE1_9BACT|nr:RNA polymerase sigma-70 factor [Chitinophaga ginsengisoli]PSL34438.1 RNA polymerase sigma-70 factor (ECF subfamily) [Chitinophaga ginsengisoli]